MFKPISMKKGDLALMYFPDDTRKSASRRLSRWISRCRPLGEALAATGYHPRQRWFTARQVRIIVEYLDPP